MVTSILHRSQALCLCHGLCSGEISRVVTHHNFGQVSPFLVFCEVKTGGLFSDCPSEGTCIAAPRIMKGCN